MSKTHAGWMLLGFALLMLIGNLADIISQWQSWQIATTPAFIGAVLKQISSVGLAAAGGKLLPAPTDKE